MAYLDARPLAATCCRIRRITAGPAIAIRPTWPRLLAAPCTLGWPSRRGLLAVPMQKPWVPLCFLGSGTCSRE